MEIKAEKLVASGVIAAGTAVWGWFGWLVIIWAGCMIVDYVTGSAAAIKERDWNSARAREGIWHKVGQAIAVAVAGCCDITLGLILNIDGLSLPFRYTVLICPVVVAWYILTELGSILENAVIMGANVHPLLRKILKITADTLEKTGEHIGESSEKKEDGDNGKGGSSETDH